MIKDLFFAAINLIFPSSCAACCLERAEYPLNLCPRCKDSLLSLAVPLVSSLPHIFQIFSCCPYKAWAKSCIKELKYHKGNTIINEFTELIQKTIKENPYLKDRVDLIVPVPMHWIRLKKRGFNHAEIIARKLSQILSVPISCGSLKKIKNTKPQTSLSKTCRRNNLKNSFSVSNANYIKGKKILLVDDVMTTGATLETCAKVLLRTGAKEVMGFTLAKTM